MPGAGIRIATGKSNKIGEEATVAVQAKGAASVAVAAAVTAIPATVAAPAASAAPAAASAAPLTAADAGAVVKAMAQAVVVTSCLWFQYLFLNDWT